MANVGDLFINVRAKTGALQKGLRSARRSLSKFAKSGTAIIAGIAGAFGIFKTFQFLMGSLIGNSKEFREAWAKIGIQIAEAGKVFARKFGSSLAKGLSDLSKWASESETLKEIFEGIGPLFTDVIIPAVQTLSSILEPFRRLLAWMISNLDGTSQKMAELGKGITDPSQIESAADFRSSIGARPVAGGFAPGQEFGNTAAGQELATKFLKTIAERVEVPK